MSIGSGVIADIWRAEERTVPMAAFVVSPFIGPTMGYVFFFLLSLFPLFFLFSLFSLLFLFFFFFFFSASEPENAYDK